MRYSNPHYALPSASHATQQGFTLVELMISLVLGLLISAAVVQIYLTNVRTSTVQKSGSELQDASVFGIQQLESHIRLANAGNPTTQINDTSVKGGIVLTGTNIGVAKYPTPAYLSHSSDENAGDGNNGWTGSSNIALVPSDQLTIQFTNISGNVISDCEGNDINNGDMAIERYFIRPTTSDNSTGLIKNLVLACDAGRLILNSDGQPVGIQTFTPSSDQHNFGMAGLEFMPNVDQFKVLLGTQTTAAGSAGLFRYLPVKDYMALPDPKPAIISIKIGMMVHGSTPIIGTTDNGDKPYTILGTSQSLKTDPTRKQQVHTTYESTVLLRNARITNITTSSGSGSV